MNIEFTEYEMDGCLYIKATRFVEGVPYAEIENLNTTDNSEAGNLAKNYIKEQMIKKLSEMPPRMFLIK